MHWIIKLESRFIEAKALKEDLKNLNLSNDVHLEQNTDTGGRITAVRMYIREDRSRNLIHRKIREAIPLFNGYGYKVERIE